MIDPKLLLDAPDRLLGLATDLLLSGDPVRGGEFALPQGAGLGIELNLTACAAHPYQKNSFPSLWDNRWLKEFTKGRPDPIRTDR